MKKSQRITQDQESKNHLKTQKEKNQMKKLSTDCLRRPENDVDTSSESEASYVINHIEDKLMYLAISNRPRDEHHVFSDPNSSNARPQWCDASRTRVWDLKVAEPPSIEGLRCQVDINRREIVEQ
jgi:hypothetical protein